MSARRLVSSSQAALKGTVSLEPTRLEPLVEYYDGEHWTTGPPGTWSQSRARPARLPGSSTAPLLNYLFSVKAASAQDVWAVGTAYGPGEYVTLTEHFNGTTWQVVPARTAPERPAHSTE